MKKHSWLDRLRYTFDNTLSAGPLALMGWLGLASALLILLASLFVRITTGGQMRFLYILWDVLFQSLTPNPVAPDAGPLPFVLTMLPVTLGSIFMVSILIGVLTTGIESRIHALRKGRSQVLESGHTVILGWDEQHIFTIISELAIANQNQAKSQSVVVILGNKDKVEMEDAVREKAGPLGQTRVVCRSGDPISQADLDIVSVNTARSVIVLAPEDDDPDASVIKTILAIVNNPHRRPEPYHIVAEIHHPGNREAAQLVGGHEVKLILIEHLTSHIIAQTCRRSGLSVVYADLLNFSGDEIYFQEEPALVGRTFGEALLAFEDSVILGLELKGGRAKLNPPMDTPLQPGDQLIAISADNDTIRLSDSKALDINEAAICQGQSVAIQPERTLIIGWNSRVSTVIRELDHYAAPGSAVTVAANEPTLDNQLNQIQPGLKHLTVNPIFSPTTEWSSLEQLHIEQYRHVAVMAYSDTLSPHQADARTLMTLLHLRDIAKHSRQSFTIVSEMLDEQNRNLAEVTQADDFIISGKMGSLMLAQISEDKRLLEVFDDLFGTEGSEIYFKPAANYVQPNLAVNFYTVVEAARRRGEVAIGYRLKAQANDAACNYGVVLNPRKSEVVKYTPADRVIVLAEHE